MADNSKEKKIEVTTPSSKEKKSKNKMLLLIGGICIFIIAIGSLTLDTGPKYVPKVRHSKFIDLTPGDDADWRTEMQVQTKSILKSQEATEANTDKALQIVSQALKELRENKEEVRRLSNEVTILKKRKPIERVLVTDSKTAQKEEKPLEEMSLEERINSQLSDLERQDEQSANQITDKPTPPTLPENPNTSPRRVLPPPPGVPYGKSKEFESQNNKTVEKFTTQIGVPSKTRTDMIFVAREEDYHEDPNAIETESAYVENEYAGMIPPGSFAKISLLSGVDSGTSEYTRANPQPILARVQTNAQLPQGNYALKSCFVLGSSYGDLSSERVFIQLSRITCVDKGRGMMLTGRLNGYVTDADSTQGLKGKVIRRNGALLGKSMLAGFASGLSSVAASAGTSQVTTVSGAINSTLDTDRILETGGMEGVSSTMEMIAQQYMDEAKNMFPVISVSGGRVGTMVLTQGTKLEWKSYTGKFQKQIKPSDVDQPLF